MIAPGSNFRGEGTQPVGAPSALSGFGTSDMAGNVKEWCWNESSFDKRFAMGGGYEDPTYVFGHTDAYSPWSRMPDLGFRCAVIPSRSAEAAAKVERWCRDYNVEKPVSDEIFAVYKGFYSYDRRELNAKVEETEDSSEWSREKISFDAGYGGERMVANLYLPKNAAPPYQVVVYFPGGNAIGGGSVNDFGLDGMDFLVQSGRAFVFPVFKGSLERKGEYKGRAVGTLWRDHIILWSKDLGRTLDYLETQKEIDPTKLAYFGFSWGGGVALVLLGVEQRFGVAILRAGGLWQRPFLAESDPLNFAPHVKLPVLMLNDRYDDAFPVDAAQLPLLRLLGTPEKDKRYVVSEACHGCMPGKDLIRETLDWLDKYLGPVKR